MPSVVPTRRLAICGIYTSCASTNPVVRTMADFQTLKGSELLDKVPFDFDAHGITPVPLVFYRSLIGGPVPHSLFDKLAGTICLQLEDEMPVDGLIVLFHGAMLVPGLADPEGLLLARLRRILGEKVILGASFSRHAQITKVVTEQIDVLAACRTAPETDAQATRVRVATMVAGAMLGGERPSVVRIPIPMVAAGEMTSTLTSPCADLYDSLARYRKSDGILDANLTIGYPWSDTVRAMAAAVVTCTNRSRGLDAARKIAQQYWDLRDDLTLYPPGGPPQAQLDKAARMDFCIIADSGDNPSAGGVGDRADMLQLIREYYPHHSTLIAGIAAPEACAELARGALQITVGGQLGNGGPKVTLRPSMVRQIGEDWCIRTGAMTVVLSPKKRSFQQYSDYIALKLNPRSYRLLVLKCGYPGPEVSRLGNAQLIALTDGAVCQNMSLIPNHFRPKPTWPFDRTFEFCAEHVNVY